MVFWNRLPNAFPSSVVTSQPVATSPVLCPMSRAATTVSTPTPAVLLMFAMSVGESAKVNVNAAGMLVTSPLPAVAKQPSAALQFVKGKVGSVLTTAGGVVPSVCEYNTICAKALVHPRIIAPAIAAARTNACMASSLFLRAGNLTIDWGRHIHNPKARRHGTVLRRIRSTSSGGDHEQRS